MRQYRFHTIVWAASLVGVHVQFRILPAVRSGLVVRGIRVESAD